MRERGTKLTPRVLRRIWLSSGAERQTESNETDTKSLRSSIRARAVTILGVLTHLLMRSIRHGAAAGRWRRMHPFECRTKFPRKYTSFCTHVSAGPARLSKTKRRSRPHRKINRTGTAMYSYAKTLPDNLNSSRKDVTQAPQLLPWPVAPMSLQLDSLSGKPAGRRTKPRV